jgi:hypothetical protein
MAQRKQTKPLKTATRARKTAKKVRPTKAKKRKTKKSSPSPLAKSIFEFPYDGKDSVMDFSDTLKALKAGYRVSREGWNGPGQFVFLAPAKVWKLNKKTNNEKRLIGKRQLPLLLLSNSQGQVVQWIPSAGDLFADDWYVG